MISAAPLFGAPMYRWLSAKSSIQTHFLVFYTRVPEGMTRVDDVRLEGRQLIVEDRAAAKKIVLGASLGL